MHDKLSQLITNKNKGLFQRLVHVDKTFPTTSFIILKWLINQTWNMTL